MYFILMFCLLSLRNVYVIWLIIELMFVFFFLFSINNESKNVGLIIYFFFQSFVSLMLFMVIMFRFNKLIFLLLSAKLGLFPFFYWIVIVRIKVGFLSNMFVLRLQKVSVFWLLWLLLDLKIGLLYFFVYLRIFFVIVNLIIISDLWLLIVYSSISNTGIIIIALYGSCYFLVIVLYLIVILLIIYWIKIMLSYIELLLIVFFFLVIPPFMLFFIKFYIILRLDFFIKLGFFLVIFDVFILLYYFSLVFIKFILIDLRVLIYFLNILLVFIILFFSNCVTMIIFNKS